MNVIFLMLESPIQWVLVLAVIFLLFGASRLPQLAKSLGQSRKAFREGMREAEEEYELEEAQKKNVAPKAQLSAISDDELLEEARRRAAMRQQ